MTSKKPIRLISKGVSSMSIKSLIGKKMSREVTFMGEKVTISKLSVAEVMEIQEKAKKLESDDSAGLDVLITVIRSAVEGANELSDQDFEALPMDELAKLSGEIMKFSGIQGEKPGKSS
jgi:hypothetical protein